MRLNRMGKYIYAGARKRGSRMEEPVQQPFHVVKGRSYLIIGLSSIWEEEGVEMQKSVEKKMRDCGCVSFWFTLTIRNRRTWIGAQYSGYICSVSVFYLNMYLYFEQTPVCFLFFNLLNYCSVGRYFPQDRESMCVQYNDDILSVMDREKQYRIGNSRSWRLGHILGAVIAQSSVDDHMRS